MKLPLAFCSQPEGGGEDGAMPSGTDWAKDEAAKKSGPRRLEGRMMAGEAGYGRRLRVDSGSRNGGAEEW